MKKPKQTEFIRSSRVRSSSLNVATGIANQLLVLILSFVFRTIFLMLLSKEYLGINGLFTNILSILSFAELGIGSAIVYRLYEPIATNNLKKVAALLDFFKKIYMIISLVILVIGLCLIPFLQFFIKDASEIPSDVNLYAVYILFLMNSVTSYWFQYKTNILIADQKLYYHNIIVFVRYVLIMIIKIIVLYLTKNFTLILIVELATMLFFNMIYSVIVGNKYKFVFNLRERLDKQTVKCILKDTTGVLSYKIGDAISTSIDNILITSFVGLAIGGIYSNYSIIFVSVCHLLAQILGTSTASLGNYRINASKEEYYCIYKRLLFANLWIVSCANIAYFVMINPFITVWLGEEYLFDFVTTAVISLSFFFSQMRHVNSSIIDSTGLFTKDKWRPITEAIINVVVSIILVQFMGVSGIFLGTIISRLSLQVWREPQLIYKTQFGVSCKKYFASVLCFLIFTIIFGLGLYYVINLMPGGLGYLILKFLIVAVVPSLLLALLTFWTDEFKFFKTLGLRFVKKIFRTKH